MASCGQGSIDCIRDLRRRRCRARGRVDEISMQDAKTYYQYAANCRRMASTMNVNDDRKNSAADG
jgi:hypothetical protein